MGTRHPVLLARWPWIAVRWLPGSLSLLSCPAWGFLVSRARKPHIWGPADVCLCEDAAWALVMSTVLCEVRRGLRPAAAPRLLLPVRALQLASLSSALPFALGPSWPPASWAFPRYCSTPRPVKSGEKQTLLVKSLPSTPGERRPSCPSLVVEVLRWSGLWPAVLWVEGMPGMLWVTAEAGLPGPVHRMHPGTLGLGLLRRLLL